jgi:hypothetical protein
MLIYEELADAKRLDQSSRLPATAAADLVLWIWLTELGVAYGFANLHSNF